MSRQNKIRWNKFALAGLLAAVFLVSGLFFTTGRALAAPAFSWTNATTIAVTGFDQGNLGGPSSFNLKCTGSGVTVSCAPQNPSDFRCDISVKVTDGTAKLTYIPYFGNPPFGNCQELSTTTSTITIANADKGPAAATPGAATPADPTADTTDTDLELECVNEHSMIKWLLCPVVHAITNTVVVIDGLINDLLTVNQKKIFETDCAVSPNGCKTAQGYHAAWATFRSFAVALLIIAGLIMVISHGLGYEMLDAYTIRKILPRLIIAVIGITLSWELMRFFVVFTNDLGLGIQQVIFYPFRNLEGGDGLGNTALLVGMFATIGVAAAMTLVGVASFALTAILAALIAFLVLILRQLVIVVLIMFAPIAIACSVLPNTQGIWKLWHESFTKALLMFPIIVAFIAVGRVFAVSAIGSDITGVAPISQMIGFVAYFLPYFLIPLTFRFAGGAMRTLGGAVNDRSRGGFDRLKKFRSNRTAESMGAYKQGFDRTRVGTALKDGHQRNLAKRAAIGSGAIGVRNFGTARYRSEMENAEFGHLGAGAAEAIKNNPSAAANDDANKIARIATSKRDFMQKYAEMRAGAGASQAEIDAFQPEATSQLAFTEQAFGSVMGSKQMRHTAGTAALASNSSTDSVAERAQWMRDAVSSHVMTDSQAAALVKQSGSLASSAGFGDLLGAANGTLSDADLLTRATTGFNPANSHRMRKGQAEEMAKEVFRQADVAATTHGVGSDQFAKVIADAAGMHDVMNGMTPDVREEFAKHLNGKTAGGLRIRDHEANLEAAGNAAYLDRRKTWSAAAAGAGGGIPGGLPGGGAPGGGAGGPGGAGGGAGGARSDIHLKRNISPVLRTPDGIQLYRFQYLWDDQVYIGVMAQDLIYTHPEALSKDRLGYYMVDYSMLGLRMMTLEEWEARKSNPVRN